MKNCILVTICLVALTSAGPTPFFKNITTGEERIVGGVHAGEGQFPYIVAVRTYANNIPYGCGGTLITKRTVMTAGHCVKIDNITSITVRVGTNDQNSGGTSHIASHTIIHEKYSPVTDGAVYDIALAILEEAVTLGQRVKLAKLPSANLELKKGDMVIAMGWGRLRLSLDDMNKLRTVNLTITTNEECAKWHESPIIESELCAESPRDKGICFGDSGSPLVIGDGSVVGIASFIAGNSCATEATDVFTRVTSFLDWIRKHKVD